MKNESKEHTILMFLKFGEEKYMRDLFENGTIYMNQIDFFRKAEDGKLRGDKYEGVSEVFNYPPGQFKLTDSKTGAFIHEGNYLSLHTACSYENVLGNIYSLFAISSFGCEEPSTFKIDVDNKKFGSHCVMIKNLPEFLSRMKKAFNDKSIPFHGGFVHYYDRYTANGKIDLFSKPLEYEFQKEFRFYADTEKETPLVLQIGSLSDIAEIRSTIEIVETLELVTP